MLKPFICPRTQTTGTKCHPTLILVLNRSLLLEMEGLLILFFLLCNSFSHYYNQSSTCGHWLYLLKKWYFSNLFSSHLESLFSVICGCIVTTNDRHGDSAVKQICERRTNCSAYFTSGSCLRLYGVKAQHHSGHLYHSKTSAYSTWRKPHLPDMWPPPTQQCEDTLVKGPNYHLAA